MNDGKNKPTQAKNSAVETDEIEDLKIFIQKKKIQNAALKKIIEKLNTNENQTTNK